MRKVQIVLGLMLGVFANYYYNYFFSSPINTIVVNGCRIFSAAYLQKLAKEEIIHGVTHLQKIRHRMLEEDFVQECKVQYFYPNILLIQITEKTPLAKNIDNSIVAYDKTVIVSKPVIKLTLLKVAGADYGEELNELVHALNDVAITPELCIFVRPGRWNLIYQNKLIKLPEYKIQEGLQIIMKNLQEHWFEFAKEIDLRKSGYAIVQESQGDHQKWLEDLMQNNVRRQTF